MSEKILNPVTKRMITKGGKLHQKLMKEGKMGAEATPAPETHEPLSESEDFPEESPELERQETIKEIEPSHEEKKEPQQLLSDAEIKKKSRNLQKPQEESKEESGGQEEDDPLQKLFDSGDDKKISQTLAAASQRAYAKHKEELDGMTNEEDMVKALEAMILEELR